MATIQAPSIQFGGVASGLDTKSIISALMAAEKAPLTRLQTAATGLNARSAALTTFGTAVQDLLSKIQAFTLTSAGSARSATSADPLRFTAVATSAAVPGLYKVSVDQLATSTTATSTRALGTAITDATATGFMSALPLPGAVTAGQIGLVVDGTIVTATVGNPASTSLKSVIDSIAAAIQAQAQLTDPGATVTASIVANKLQLSVAGATGTHDVRFGVGGDTSNALTILGVSGQHVANFGTGTATISGTSLLGVTQTTGTLNAAGLTGLTSTTTGVLTINGVGISYDTTVDTLNTVLTRINNSNADVIASIDRTNDRIVLSRKTAGPTAIAITDTSGTLGAALALAPGTTNAQVVGQSAQVTIDGTRVVTSDSNTVTNAIDGVTLTLLDKTTSAAALTVGVDATRIQTALTDLVTSYNALADTVDQVASHKQGYPTAPLENDTAIREMARTVRSLLMSISSSVTSTAIRSLGDIGVTSGAVGAKPGSTTRLSLDTAKLGAALSSNPVAVSSLLGANGGIFQPMIDRLKATVNFGGVVQSGQASIDSQLRQNATDQANMQTRIDAKQAMLEAKFATLESVLSKLQAQQSQLASQVTSMTSTKA